MMRTVLVIGVLCLGMVGAACAETYIPRDLDDAHQQLLKTLSAEELARIRAMEREGEMVRYHMGLGMDLRNRWGLWKGSRLSRWFNEKGIFHPDDMTGIIFDTFWDQLHDKPFDLDQKIARYQEYWRSMEKPKEGSPRDGAKIAWVITQGRGRDTIHLGLSASDRSYWRYEYATKKIVPANEQDTKALDELRKSWKDLGSNEEDFFQD